MAVAAPARHVRCDGAFNIRDIGGYVTSTGWIVRSGMVYRADGLHRIPPGGGAALRQLGWRTVIDLRTTREVAAGGYRGEGVEVINLPMLRSTWGVPAVSHLDPLVFLPTHYLHMLDEGAPAIRAAFALLAGPARLPAVFHCSAGKDRTGVLAALVLSALGVADEVIAADYHLSALAVPRLVAWLEATTPDGAEEMVHQPQALLSSPPEAMLIFLQALSDRFGSVERYLVGIGVEAVVLEQLRRVLLDPA